MEFSSLNLGLVFMIVVGFVCGENSGVCSDLSLFFSLFLLCKLIVFAMVRGRRFLSSCLHYMLPRKRPAAEGRGEADTVEATPSASSSSSFASLKKSRIEGLTSASGSVEATTSSKADNTTSGEITNSSTTDGGVPLSMAMADGNASDIDEDLHSRQIAVYGLETMRRLFASNVLICGMQGLGAEIGKPFDFFFFPVSISLYLRTSRLTFMFLSLRLLLGPKKQKKKEKRSY